MPNWNRESALKTTGDIGAIVLGGNSIALGIARSLGAYGIPVWVVDSVRSIAHFSRYTKRSIIADGDSLEFLLEEGKKHNLKNWVVFPVSDSNVEFLAAHHGVLSSLYQITTPPADVAKFALDKRLTYQRAAELGIATPWTRVTRSSTEVDANSLPYPVILKPAINHRFFPHSNVKALSVDNAADFHRQFAVMSKTLPADEILIQERIPGGGENQFSCAALCKEGKAYATLVARRTRQYPLDFGNASSFVETIDQPIVEADGRRWLESVGFDGMAEVEFKFDPRDGRYKILDVNMRAWGWHTLGKAAGIDFSYLLWRQKLELPIPSIPRQRRAAYCRELNDLIAIAKSPNRAREIKSLLRAITNGGFTTATFNLRDPVPLFAEFGLRALELFHSRRKKRSGLAIVTLAAMNGANTVVKLSETLM